MGGTSLTIGINNASNSSASANYNFNTGKWYHIAATYDGTTYTLYVNGSQIQTGTITNALITDMNNIGINCRASSSNGTTRWIGDSTVHYINDVRIYNHCLSAAEIH